MRQGDRHASTASGSGDRLQGVAARTAKALTASVPIVFVAPLEFFQMSASFEPKVVAASVDDALQAHVVLVNTGDRRVLIDAGEGGSRQPTTGRLAASLQAAGIEPTAVDIVVLTHAHPDHLWGAVDTKAGTMRFPNARYVISDREWDYWSDPERHGPFPERFRGMIPGTQAAFRLIADRTTRIKPGTDIVSGIATVESRGHTPGHMSVQLSSGGEQALVVGDAITQVLISFRHPEWRPGYDGEMDQAVVTRRRLLDQAATDRILVLGYHFPFPGVGNVARDGAAYRWVPEHWRWDF